jgi:UPF0755 protein
MQSIKKFLIALVLMVAMLVLMTGCMPEDAYAPMDPQKTDNVIVDIPQGSSVTSMGNILFESGLIRQADYFKARVKVLGVDSKLKAGRYAFQLSQSMDDIINHIVSGDVYRDLIKVTIPEGYEIKQIVETLEAAGLVKSESFYALMASAPLEYAFLEGIPEGERRLEGFLFPATYTFEKGVSEEKVLKALLDKFDTVFKPEYYDTVKSLDLTVYQLITMASIVEREGQVRSELPLIAGVFYNRIQKDIKLESCATIQYALGDRKAKLYNKDLEIESPYNTYKYFGLPLGPIASPGEAALQAALFPEASDKLFFVLSNKGDGSHIFSKTYAEHLQAKKANE